MIETSAITTKYIIFRQTVGSKLD